MVGKVVHTSAAELVRYHEQHLSNGDYHLEEGKVRGEFIGALADEWGLSDEPIFKEDAVIPPRRMAPRSVRVSIAALNRAASPLDSSCATRLSSSRSWRRVTLIRPTCIPNPSSLSGRAVLKYPCLPLIGWPMIT